MGAKISRTDNASVAKEEGDGADLDTRAKSFEKHSYWQVPESPFDDVPVALDFNIPRAIQFEEIGSRGEDILQSLKTHGYCIIDIGNSQGEVPWNKLYKSAEEYFAHPNKKSTDKHCSAGYKLLHFPNRDNRRDPEKREVFQLYWGIPQDIRKANYYGFDVFEKDFKDLYRFQYDMCDQLLEEIVNALGLEKNNRALSDLCGTIEKNDGTNLCIFRYEDKYGYKTSQKCMVHEDHGFLTVGAKSTAPGLQILSADQSKWLSIEHKMTESQVVVYCGRAMQLVTGNVLKATTHRVVREPNTIRYSAPFAFKPLKESTLDRLPNIGTSEFEDGFEVPCTFKDMLMNESWNSIHRKMARFDNGAQEPVRKIESPMRLLEVE